MRCVSSKLLVLSSNAGLIVLTTSNGETVWSSDYAEDSAACSKDVVYASGVPRDSIRAFDLYTGERLWDATSPRKDLSWVLYNPQNDELIASWGDFNLIEAKNGVIKTKFPAFGSPPDYGDMVLGPIFLVDRGELFTGGTVQDAQTGELIHEEKQFSTKYPPTLTPDTMYLSARNVGIVAYDRTGYNVKWIYQPQSSTPLDPVSPVAISNRIGYAIFSDTSVRAFNPETGQELGYWQPAPLEFRPWCAIRPFACDEKAKASLAVSGNTLFISMGDGRVYAFEQAR